MARSGSIAVVAALLLGGTSLAAAQNSQPAGGFRGAVGGAHGKPSINKTTSRPNAPDPYYRLSDRYYGHSDPYHGLFGYYAVPPYNPGYAYRYTGWR
jgi:hypothetical protein